MSDALMMTFPVKMVDVFIEHQSQAALADKPQSVEALVLERFYESFAMGVGIGRRHGTEYGLDCSGVHRERQGKMGFLFNRLALA